SSSCHFFFHAPPPTDFYTLSLHDALPIWLSSPITLPPFGLLPAPVVTTQKRNWGMSRWISGFPRAARRRSNARFSMIWSRGGLRSEEHTSELQSRFDLVCRLLLEKKKKTR